MRRSAPGAGSATRAGRCACTRAALEVMARHGGAVPTTYDDLLALPGVGAYTAAAVASFAYGQRHAVLDTNVRRVLARAVDGRAEAAASPTVAERRVAEALLPEEPSVAARWAVAVMELGALVCTARAPRCDGLPAAGPVRLAACRTAGPRRSAASPAAVHRHRPAGPGAADGGAARAAARGPAGRRRAARAVWPDAVQRDRALAGLVADGLAVEDGGSYRLPRG